MLSNIFQILTLIVAAHGSTSCVIDQTDNGSSLVVCNAGEAVNAPSVWVGFEGTTYGTVETVSAHSVKMENIKL